MERFLCLDIGDKRIGVAVSDPFNSYALPVETYNRKNLTEDLKKIGELVKDKAATAVVCGLPVNFDGTPSLQTKKAQYFIDRLKETLKVKVYSVDERCTTVAAEETLKSLGKDRKEIKSAVDSLAAAEILRGFLAEYNKSLKKGESKMAKEHKHDEHCDCGCEEHDIHEHCDCGCEDEIVELTTDEGKKLKFYVVGTIEYKGKTYSAFEPAEEIEGLEDDDLVIFELAGEDEEAELLPIEDEALLDEVFQEFCKALDEEEAAAEAESLEPTED